MATATSGGTSSLQAGSALSTPRNSGRLSAWVPFQANRNGCRCRDESLAAVRLKLRLVQILACATAGGGRFGRATLLAPGPTTHFGVPRTSAAAQPPVP